MATKKTSSRAPAKEQKHRSPSISARIDRLVDYENTKVKAIRAMSIPKALTKPLMKWNPVGMTQRTGRPKLIRWSRTTTTASPFSMMPVLPMSIRDSE